MSGCFKEANPYPLYYKGELKYPESLAKAVRKACGLTQNDLYKICGVTRHLLSQIENGDYRYLKYEQAVKLLKAYKEAYDSRFDNFDRIDKFRAARWLRDDMRRKFPETRGQLHEPKKGRDDVRDRRGGRELRPSGAAVKGELGNMGP
jgi:Predicted transcriptional regulators